MTVLRRLVRSVAIALAALAALLILALLLLQTPWARDYLRGFAERRAEAALGTEVDIGALGGNLLTRAELRDLRIGPPAQPVVTVPQAIVDYSIYDLLTGAVDVASVTLREPVIHLRRTDAGALNLAMLRGAGGQSVGKRQERPMRDAESADQSSDDRPAPATRAASPRTGRGWSVAEILVENGTITIGDDVVTTETVNAPERLVNVDGDVGIRSRPEGGVRLDIDALTFRTVSPHLAVERAEGEVVIAADTLRFDELALDTSAGSIRLDGAIRDRQRTPVYDLSVAANNVQLPAVAPVVPALEGYALSPTVTASVEGPADALHARFETHTQAGAVSGDVTLDVTGPQRHVSGTIRTEDLNLAAVNLADSQTDITATAKIDLALGAGGLQGLTGTYQLTAPEFAYGEYNARNLDASGDIENGRVRVDATAGVYGGTAETKGTIVLPSRDRPVQYDLDGKLRDVSPAQLPAAVRVPDAVSRRGADLDFELRGRGGEIEVGATLLDFSLAGAEFSERTSVQVSRRAGRLQYSAEGSVGSLDLRRLGRELGIEGLTSARYASDINAQFDITGAGTELATLTLRGRAALANSSLSGVHFPELTVRPDLTRGAGTIAVDGRFERLDLAALTGNPALESRLHGSIDARAALDNLAQPDFSLGAIEASGRLTLVDSRLAGVAIDRGVIDATLSESLTQVRELSLTGPDLDVDAHGRLALDRTGRSDFRYVIDTPALQRFGALAIPLQGDVLLEGHVAGNLARLVVEGTLSGTQVGYGNTSALSVHSKYSLVIPDLSVARTQATAVTELEDLEAAGRSFTTVKARIEYAASNLEFTTTVHDAGRTIDAEGRLVMHPDHQELHLRRFAFRLPDSTWTLSGTKGATIRYGGRPLQVSDFLLLNEEGGRIAVDGALGAQERVLTASIAGLRLDSLDDLVAPEEPLSGVLGVTATVRGTFGDPRVDATVELTNGAYRGFPFERAGGTVEYTPRLVRLDVAVEQREGAVLTAKGVVPVAEAAGERLWVAVRSTPVDLALVQTFTDELQGVSGTIEVDATVRGSLAQPLLEGSLHVRNGAFTVLAAQSRYTGFDTDVTFDAGVVNVREFHLVDDEGNRLRIGGQLALDGRRPAGLNVRIRSDNFELADNRLAELNADTDLRVTGEILRPRIEGRVALRESLLRVDRILQLTHGAYDVTPERARDEGDKPGLFAPTVDISLGIPDTLVIRGTDLRAPGGNSVGLGNVNITIGGELQIRKTPGESMRLAGELATVRGTYEFQGRQFAIQRDGGIEFMGTPELNPRLDIRAEREISGVVAGVHIGGVLDAPELELSSQPPMEDAEILSLIVFNQPLSLLGTGAQISLATRATALASGFVASQLTESLSEVLELDLLEIQTTTRDGTLAPVLTVGEQFGRLFLKLRQRFGAEAVSEALIEYRIAEWLRLQTSYAQADAAARNLLQRVEAGGLDLIFFFSY